MRKPAFLHIYVKTKAQISWAVSAQLISPCFSYTDSTFPLLPIKTQNFKPLAIFCGCTAKFVSDLVGIPKDRFPCDEAHKKFYLSTYN